MRKIELTFRRIKWSDENLHKYIDKYMSAYIYIYMCVCVCDCVCTCVCVCVCAYVYVHVWR